MGAIKAASTDNSEKHGAILISHAPGNAYAHLHKLINQFIIG